MRNNVVTKQRMAQVLRETRLAHGLTQVQLAEKANLSEKMIYLYEGGYKAMSIHAIVATDKVLQKQLVPKLIGGA